MTPKGSGLLCLRKWGRRVFDINLRLVTMLGFLTAVVIVGLALDYLNFLRRPIRLGLWTAILSIFLGFVLTINAVLPDNHFYGKVFAELPTDQKLVALTFDDGPYPPYTNQILDILKEYEVPATFFVIGKNAAKHPELITRILAEGHQLGNHTYNHIDLLKADRKTITDEVIQTNRVIEKISGQKTTIVRVPHGFRDPVVMDVMAEQKLQVVGWSVMARDWTNPGVDTIVSRITNRVKSGSIILLHDGDGVASQDSRAQTAEATRLIIRELLSQGYRFVTVNEILGKTEE